MKRGDRPVGETRHPGGSPDAASELFRAGPRLRHGDLHRHAPSRGGRTAGGGGVGGLGRGAGREVRRLGREEVEGERLRPRRAGVGQDHQRAASLEGTAAGCRQRRSTLGLRPSLRQRKRERSPASLPPVSP